MSATDESDETSDLSLLDYYNSKEENNLESYLKTINIKKKQLNQKLSFGPFHTDFEFSYRVDILYKDKKLIIKLILDFDYLLKIRALIHLRIHSGSEIKEVSLDNEFTELRNYLETAIDYIPVGDDQKMKIEINFPTLKKVRIDVKHTRAQDSYVTHDSDKLYTCKELTNCVGLDNQGSTCYVNCTLQSLFHLPVFRRLIYNIPVCTNENNKNGSIVLNIQRLFVSMQLSSTPCSTKPLTESFGWDDDISADQDAEEFIRVFLRYLEDRLKDTHLKDDISNLFRGKTKTIIKDDDGNVISDMIESFYDIHLNVRGCATIEDSFDFFSRSHDLRGSNKYKQGDKFYIDANIKTEFVSFPIILHLHLKRHEYDRNTNSIIKINDKIVFPDVLNLDRYVCSGSENECSSFELYGVIVHSGDPLSGHYCAYLKVSQFSNWYEFNDSLVKLSTYQEAVVNNYGYDDSEKSTYCFSERNQNNTAYILVYVRSDSVEKVFNEIKDSEIPEHLTRYYEEMCNQRKN